MEENDGYSDYNRDEIHSKAVRAGKRTYFFDVKATRGKDLYLTITESKKRFHKDGKQYYEKHKLFLYKEDFEKFQDGLGEAFEKIEELKNDKSGEFFSDEVTPSPSEHLEPKDKNEVNENAEFTNINFEDI